MNLGKPSKKNNKKCGFNPQGGGFGPDPHFLKSVDFLGGGSWIQNPHFLDYLALFFVIFHLILDILSFVRILGLN